jgi:GTP cyclohydrolase II
VSFLETIARARAALEVRVHLARLSGDSLAARREIEAARRLYAEMGATAQVERLGKQISP